MDNDKQIGLIGTTAIVLGSMMGSGIALLPSSLASIGSITTISWIIATLGALGLGYIFSYLANKDPQTGGVIAYAEEVSPILGFQTAILYFYASWVGIAAITITGVSYLSPILPILKDPFFAVLTAIAILWVLIGINLTGAKMVGALATFGLILLLIPVLLTATYGWHFFDYKTFIENWNVAHASSAQAVSSGITLCIWSFIGLEGALINTAIIKNPGWTIPRATLIGIIICASTYILSSTVLIGIFPAKTLAESNAPFLLASSLMIGKWSDPFVTSFIAFACFTSLSVGIMATGQAGIRAAKDYILPSVFMKTRENGIPAKSICIIGIGATILLIAFSLDSKDTQELFTNIVSLCVLLLIFPYFYTILNFSKMLIQAKKKFLGILCCTFSTLFCFAAFLGAHKHTLQISIVAGLAIFLFYESKNRLKFVKILDTENNNSQKE
ncbi:MAG: cadB [Gammaproteobacteria bacterium]|jgi:cadaverine:lysine antiporter|nr:cadB [Gammaproteobacteria bacterium]